MSLHTNAKQKTSIFKNTQRYKILKSKPFTVNMILAKSVRKGTHTIHCFASVIKTRIVGKHCSSCR